MASSTGSTTAHSSRTPIRWTGTTTASGTLDVDLQALALDRCHPSRTSLVCRSGRLRWHVTPATAGFVSRTFELRQRTIPGAGVLMPFVALPLTVTIDQDSGVPGNTAQLVATVAACTQSPRKGLIYEQSRPARVDTQRRASYPRACLS